MNLLPLFYYYSVSFILTEDYCENLKVHSVSRVLKRIL